MIRYRWMWILCFAVFLGLSSSQAGAEILGGVRTGAYFDVDSAFIGGELLVDFAPSWYFNPNIEYVFLDRGSLITFNLDVHYDLPIESRWYFWLGAGPAVLHHDPDNPFRDNDTEFGVNLFGGAGFPIADGRLIPYVQPKIILADDSEFSLAIGLRF